VILSQRGRDGSPRAGRLREPVDEHDRGPVSPPFRMQHGMILA
jgi:hypothetical protein